MRRRGNLWRSEQEDAIPPKKKGKPTFNNDHVPAKAQLLKRAAKLGAFKQGKGKKVKDFNTCVKNGVINGGMAIAIPVKVHYKGGPMGARTTQQIKSDAHGPAP